MSNEERLEEIVTMFGLKISPSDYPYIVSFCEDFGIKGVVGREKMQIELGSSSAFMQPLKNEVNVIYVMDNVAIYLVEKMSDDGDMLVIGGHSPAIEALSSDIIESTGEHALLEEPFLSIPLATGGDYSDLNLDELSLKLREYLSDDRLTFMEFTTNYYTEEEYFSVLDGIG